MTTHVITVVAEAAGLYTATAVAYYRRMRSFPNGKRVQPGFVAFFSAIWPLGIITLISEEIEAHRRRTGQATTT